MKGLFPRPAATLGLLLLEALGTASWAAGPWLQFPGESAYEEARCASILAGTAPDLLFPLFGAELPAEGTRFAEPRKELRLELATPSAAWDSPFASIDEISTGLYPATELPPPIPALPEMQEALGALPPPFTFSAGTEIGGVFSIRGDLGVSWRRDWLRNEGATWTWETKDWMTGLFADAEFPRRSWISYAREGFGLAAGRFPSGIGAGHFGSTLMNPEAPWYDQVRFHLGDQNFRFAWILGSSSAMLGPAEADIQWRQREGGYGYWDRMSDLDASASRNALKLFNYHLLEWSPIPRLRLGLAEMSLMGGQTPSLSFLLPTLAWHNVYAAGHSNVGAALLASAVPLDGLFLSGQFFVDDTRASDDPANSKPNSYAWQLSSSWMARVGEGASLELGAEYAHVDTWTYVRWQPYLEMYQRQILPGGSRGIDIPLGDPYGPDVDHGGLWATLRLPSGAWAELSWELVRKGPVYLGMIEAVDNLQTADTTLENIPVYYDFGDYAGSAALAEILARPDEIRQVFRFSAGLPLGWGFSARASATYGYYTNWKHISGAESRFYLVYAGLSLGLGR